MTGRQEKHQAVASPFSDVGECIEDEVVVAGGLLSVGCEDAFSPGRQGILGGGGGRWVRSGLARCWSHRRPLCIVGGVIFAMCKSRVGLPAHGFDHGEDHTSDWGVWEGKKSMVGGFSFWGGVGADRSEILLSEPLGLAQAGWLRWLGISVLNSTCCRYPLAVLGAL